MKHAKLFSSTSGPRLLNEEGHIFNDYRNPTYDRKTESLVIFGIGAYRGGKKNSVREKFCREKFCPNPYFAWEKLLSHPAGSGKYLDRREAPKIFEGILPIIRFFV